MTEREALNWDAVQNAIADAVQQAADLLASVPDDMAHGQARNRIVAGMIHGENFRDALAAARARMPKEA